MSRRTFHSLLTAALLAFAAQPLLAQGQRGPRGNAAGRAAATSDSAIVNGLQARSIGPAVMSGRVVDIAVASSPGARGGELGTVVYVAAASGGVWKSTNAGISWTPVFDDAGVGSIGDVAVAPSNSDIVWVGTGEANSQRSSSYGDGVYRSLDGGETFQHMGLRESQHVGRILVRPDNPDVVFVAAVGPLWAAGGQRGLFRSTDGGETWDNVLSIDEHTGVTDIVMDPRDSDVMYAASYQRERRAYSYVGGGPGSGIWKSTDGGDTWTRLHQGLPTGDMGRIGLDISLSQPRTLYAVIEGSGAGVYRTDNEGASWRQMSDIQSIPWYFGQIRVDPQDPEVVYHLGVPLVRSVDGGRTWENTGRGPHSDNHALWINPDNPSHLILGNDGGVYVSRDRGETWDFSPNLPISQFYTVGYDMAEPFFGVYGGLQDNSTWGGPSRTMASMGIPNSLWFRMAGGDGFYAVVDPTDANIAYVESQNGNVLRFDRRTGDRKDIQPTPAPGEESYRFNWSAPIKISPQDHNTIYFAANYLFKSTDRGDSWTRLGEDLTQNIQEDSLPMMGSVPKPDAVARHEGTAAFSNISTIDVSEVQPGLLITGSDDGTIAISTDDGQSWRKQTHFPGVPDTTYVSKVRLSVHDANVIYATFDGHRSNDFTPYVLKSSDQGRTWTSIASNLPAFGSLRSFAEHPENPDLLFVGSEIAPWVSFDDGGSWTRITSVPPVPVHDLKVHPRDNTLIIATHGRGFYFIDDLSLYQHLAEARAADAPYLFPVADALAFLPNSAPTSGLSASRDYSGDNPPVGTRLSYMLPSSASDLKLDVVGPDGQVVSELDASSGAGVHNVWWDLTVDTPWDGPPEQQQQQSGGFGGFGGFFGGGRGPLVLPGQYTARLTMGGAGGPTVLEQSFTVEKDPNVTLTMAQLQELQGMRMQQMRLNSRLQMVTRSITGLREALTDARAALDGAEAPGAVSDQLAALQRELNSINTAVSGQGRGFGGGGGVMPDPTPIATRIRLAGGILRSTSMPTEYERQALESAPADLEREVGRLNTLISTRLPALQQAMDEAGIPWTPGRPIPNPGG